MSNKGKVTSLPKGLKLHPGYIFSTKGKGILPWMSKNLFIPHNQQYHHGLILEYSDTADDYLVVESVSKGPTIGWLSRYKPEDLEIYRVNHPDYIELGKRAMDSIVGYGRCEYDYKLFIGLFIEGIILTLSGKLPPWKGSAFKYREDKQFTCTELANKAWENMKFPIVPKGVMPFPSEFKRARDDGKIILVFPLITLGGECHEKGNLKACGCGAE